MCVCICRYMHICTCIYVFIYVYIHIYTHIYTYITKSAYMYHVYENTTYTIHQFYTCIRSYMHTNKTKTVGI